MVRWSVNHRSIVMLICFFVFISGVFIYGDMERQENPNVVAPKAVVKCIYPGASPEDIEKLIVKPLEKKINEIPEIKKLESFSMDSIGVIKVTLVDLSDEEIDKVWDDLKDDVDEVKRDLPEQAWEPEVITDFTETYGLLIALTSNQYGYKDLKEVAEELKDRLEEDPDVKAVDIDGEIHEEIHINLDMTKLEQYKIAPSTIAKLIKAHNVNIPGGNLEIGHIKVPVQTSGEYKDVEELKNTVIGISERGNPIHLKDVSDIQRTEEKKEVFITLNNQKALVVGVKYAEGKNMVKVSKRLRKIIEDFKDELYEGMHLTVFTDQADYVNDAIKLFESNLISAIILVVLVVLLAMGSRSALVVSSSIPLIIMSVFVYMKLNGMQLHQVSIASLIISLSLLVANGIVANDSMYLYLERGFDRETACVRGVNEVKIAILTSTLTSIASFLPLAMMQGVAGKFVKSLPILVSVALFSSYITSLTMVPALGYTFLKTKGEGKNKNNLLKKLEEYLKIDKFSKIILNKYKKSLGAGLKRPKFVIGISLAALLLSLMVVPSLGVQLFPPVERDQYVIDVDVKDGSTAERTGEIVEKIGEVLLKEKSIDSFMAKVGDGPLKYYITFVANNASSNKAQIIVNGKQEAIQHIQNLLDSKVPGARINVRKLENAMPVDFPVEVRITGEDISVLKKIANDVKNIVEDVPGGKNVQDTFGFDSYKLRIDVNEEKANLVGLSNYDIAATVRMAINGLEVTKLKQEYIDDDDLPVIMKIPDENKHNKEILENIFFTSSITGENIPIRQIAKIENEFAINKIIRRDTKRTITVGLFVKEGYNTEAVQKKVEEVLKDYKLPKGYTMAFGGASEERNDAFKSMKIPSVIAVAIIYLILVMQFGDLREPFIIMGTIPLSFIGIIWGLKITGYPVGFMALLGAISLMGVVVNNGIVLLDYIKLLQKEYETLSEAIIEACATRIRPIMIGMITTVISLIPLGITGGLLWAPMAYSIIFGMLVSSLLTLYVIPCAYLIVEGEKSIIRKFIVYLASK
ncbi:efflux RND transporter permease subunit [Crassaminicella thermophila]|uniref:Efflux RND transporter permease subunit n=1 Tax=Crassaminicella thermophila TaxID=2599308 RepID=A0A5C0SGH0_CRATE|nr:efflux RND transporter permease subunit [Crassaminicella thermophila]QEK13290.1 efflux RND transporter permease subunit [Crassaminicella thermophila]